MEPTQLAAYGIPPRAAEAALTNSKAASEILAAARRIGLPMPSTTSFGTERLEVGFGFDHVDQLAEWSLWLEEPIAEGITPGFFLIDAVLYDHNVTLYVTGAKAVSA